MTEQMIVIRDEPIGFEYWIKLTSTALSASQANLTMHSPGKKIIYNKLFMYLDFKLNEK